MIKRQIGGTTFCRYRKIVQIQSKGEKDEDSIINRRK